MFQSSNSSVFTDHGVSYALCLSEEYQEMQFIVSMDADMSNQSVIVLPLSISTQTLEPYTKPDEISAASLEVEVSQTDQDSTSVGCQTEY